MALRANLDQLSASDRWYYNATLHNPNSGSIDLVPARYNEQRTIPLINNCEDFYVALARLSVSGATANFPIAQPPLAALTNDADRAVVYSDLWVGLQYTVWSKATDGTGTISPTGYTSTNLAQLVLPSEDATANRSSKDSSFYHLRTLATLEDALNGAIQTAASCWGRGVWPNSPSASDFSITNAPGSTAPPSTLPRDYAPFRFGVTGAPGNDWDGAPGQGTLPLLWASFDSGGMLQLKTPAVAQISAEGAQQALNNPFLSTTPAWDVGSTLLMTAQLYFSDKLMEMLPMPTVPAYAAIKPFPALPSYTLGPSSFTPAPIMAVTDSVDVKTENTSQYRFNDQFWIDTHTLRPPSSGGPVILSPLALYPAKATAVEDPLVLNTMLQGVPPQYTPSAVLVRPITYLQWSQEYSTQSSWAVYTGLAITSNSIPAYEEAFGVNIINATGAPTSAAAATSNIIFDLDINEDAVHQIQGGLAYVPTKYRYAKMRSGTLTNVDLQFWLRKRDGFFVPWLLDAGGTINLKLMFTTTPY